MTDESAILRAYALLSQGRYDEAELMLKGAPEALNTPSGADLFARLRFEQGFADEARQIWERIHAAFPNFEPANKALAAFVPSPELQGSDDEEEGRKFPFVAILFVLFGGALVIWGLLRKPQTIVQVRERVFTNTVDRVVNVPVMSYVTSMVERVSIVTNMIPVVRREVVTNIVERVVTVERVFTNEMAKVAIKEPPETRPEHIETVTHLATNAVAENEQELNGVKSETLPSVSIPERSRLQFPGRETWVDRAILGVYKTLGLMPETRQYFMIDGEK